MFFTEDPQRWQVRNVIKTIGLIKRRWASRCDRVDLKSVSWKSAKLDEKWFFSLSGAPVVAGDSGQGEHSSSAQLLTLLDHHHALVSLLQQHTRPLVPPWQGHRGIVAGTLKRLAKRNIKWDHGHWIRVGIIFSLLTLEKSQLESILLVLVDFWSWFGNSP